LLHVFIINQTWYPGVAPAALMSWRTLWRCRQRQQEWFVHVAKTTRSEYNSVTMHALECHTAGCRRRRGRRPRDRAGRRPRRQETDARSTVAPSSTKRAMASTLSPEEQKSVLADYRGLRQELEVLYNKLGVVDADRSEHECVHVHACGAANPTPASARLLRPYFLTRRALFMPRLLTGRPS
jgi:hypothetical protein